MVFIAESLMALFRDDRTSQKLQSLLALLQNFVIYLSVPHYEKCALIVRLLTNTCDEFDYLFHKFMNVLFFLYSQLPRYGKH